MSAARFAAQEATWPAMETADIGPWRARWTEGAGRRVASARPLTVVAADLLAGLSAVEAFYQSRNADPVVQIGADLMATMSDALSAVGYRPEGRTLSLTGAVAPVAAQSPSVSTRPYLIEVDAPLAGLNELWSAGGIGPARRSTMLRAAEGRRIVARLDHRIVGAAFVGVCATDMGRAAMLHALHVAPAYRRRGVAADLTGAAARWAQDRGARELLIDVEEENAPARALYHRLGATADGGYAYFRRSVEPS